MKVSIGHLVPGRLPIRPRHVRINGARSSNTPAAGPGNETHVSSGDSHPGLVSEPCFWRPLSLRMDALLAIKTRVFSCIGSGQSHSAVL